MRKITLLAILFASFSFAANAANVLVENFGSVPVEQIQVGANKFWPYVSQFTGWDSQAPITISTSTGMDKVATVRKTSTMDNHLWLPAEKDADLTISNIPAGNFTNLKISFAMTSNGTGGDASKMLLYCNDVQVTIPSTVLGKNEYVTVPEIALANAQTLNLRFFIPAANNPSGMGYRLDNIKITGDEGGQSISNTAGDNVNIFAANGTVNFTTEKSVNVTVFNTVGQVIVNKMSEVGANQITLPKGQLLIVKVGQKAVKVKM